MSTKSLFKKIFIASDHAGVELKRHLIERFSDLNFVDLGTHSGDSVDYPDYAKRLCEELEPHLPEACGVLICGSGQGMAMRANRYPFIRAALCWNTEVARLSREHNDANVLCMGARLMDNQTAEKILEVFLATQFSGGRHAGRVDKLRC